MVPLGCTLDLGLMFDDLCHIYQLDAATLLARAMLSPRVRMLIGACNPMLQYAGWRVTDCAVTVL